MGGVKGREVQGYDSRVSGAPTKPTSHLALKPDLSCPFTTPLAAQSSTPDFDLNKMLAVGMA